MLVVQGETTGILSDDPGVTTGALVKGARSANCTLTFILCGAIGHFVLTHYPFVTLWDSRGRLIQTT